MQRGDVVWVDLDPAEGSMVRRRRLGVVVSHDGAERSARTLNRGLVTVVPISSQIKKLAPFQVLLPARSCGMPNAAKAHAEQIRSVDIQRIGAGAGRLPAGLLAALDDAIRLHLGL